MRSGTDPAMLTCAILDDYQGVGPTLADWSGLSDRLVLRDLRETFASRDALVAAIADCEIVCDDARAHAVPGGPVRAPAEPEAPPHQRHAQRRHRSGGGQGARGHVCGTASHPEPPVELTFALILGLARHLVPEVQALRTGGPWQGSVGRDLAGRPPRTPRPRQDRRPRRPDRPSLRHGGQRLEPEPHRRAGRGGGGDPGPLPRRAPGDERHRLDPPRPE